MCLTYCITSLIYRHYKNICEQMPSVLCIYKLPLPSTGLACRQQHFLQENLCFFCTLFSSYGCQNDSWQMKKLTETHIYNRKTVYRLYFASDFYYSISRLILVSCSLINTVNKKLQYTQLYHIPPKTLRVFGICWIKLFCILLVCIHRPYIGLYIYKILLCHTQNKKKSMQH